MPLLVWASSVTASGVAGSPIRDPTEYYGSRLLMGALVVAVAAVIFSLLRYRGSTNRPGAWTSLMLSVCVLPPFALLVGALLVFERGEKVEFCGSCHGAMGAYVADMTAAESHSLAAVHYRNRYIPVNQCYVCHTSFGLFGTMQAKIAGLEDVHRYYLGTFQQPIRMHAPYDNGDCLKCHADAARWLKQHSGVREALLSGQTYCLDCHGKVHPAHLLKRDNHEKETHLAISPTT